MGLEHVYSVDDELPPEFNWLDAQGERDIDKAIDHICEVLEQGIWPLTLICSRMTPRIPKGTIDAWRARSEERAQRLDGAFDIGMDRMAVRIKLTARGVDGHSTKNHKRDRLVIITHEKLLGKWDRRYRDRLMHENDPENPMPSPTFVLQPVKSLQEIERTSAPKPEGNSEDA